LRKCVLVSCASLHIQRIFSRARGAIKRSFYTYIHTKISVFFYFLFFHTKKKYMYREIHWKCCVMRGKEHASAFLLGGDITKKNCVCIYCCGFVARCICMLFHFPKKNYFAPLPPHVLRLFFLFNTFNEAIKNNKK